MHPTMVILLRVSSALSLGLALGQAAAVHMRSGVGIDRYVGPFLNHGRIWYQTTASHHNNQVAMSLLPSAKDRRVRLFVSEHERRCDAFVDCYVNEVY